MSLLFDYLPEMYLFVKDRRSRFITVSEPLWKMRGFSSELEMVGKSDFDIHPADLASQYIAEDQRVMHSGRPLPNQIWLVADETGELKWFVSSKIPLFDQRGRVIGIAGVMRNLEQADLMVRPYRELEHAVTFVLQNYGQRIDVAQLAQLAHLSVSQFGRRFKRLYQMTPQQYILRVRINAAGQLLISSDHSVAEIAAECGFYDQSYFTKQFRKQHGQTPLQYRATYEPRGANPQQTPAH